MEEPWLRGPIEGVDPLLAPILYAFRHAREDLAKWTEGLTPDELWATPFGAASVGFQIRHIAGSTGRLMTYVEDRQLAPEQLAAIESEKRPGAARDELLGALDAAFCQAEDVVRSLDPAGLRDPRTVGRKQLPSTVIGLLTHIAEHTMRHVGEAIVLVRAVHSLSCNTSHIAGSSLPSTQAQKP